MSRRKQARPRHVDDPDLDSPAISSNPVAPVVFHDDNVPEEEKLTKPEEEEEIKDNTGEISENQQSPHSPNVDAHVCGKCRAEFLELDEFVTHKKLCCKPVTLMFKEVQNQSVEPQPPKLCNGNGPSLYLSEDQDIDNFDNMSHNMSHDDHSDDEQNLAPADDEIDAGGDEENSDFDDDFNKSTEEEENDLDNLKGLTDKIKTDKNGDIQPYMKPLSKLLPGSGPNHHSNVMLEPLEATKAAVAQFAENNLPEQEKDVTRLHSTLFNLQQQQIMQLQLIHQLQQQLVAGGMQNNPLSAALLNSQLPLGAHFPGLNLNIPGLSAAFQSKNELSKSPTISESPSPKVEDLSSAEKEKETSSQPSSPVPRSSETLTSPSTSAVEASKPLALPSSTSPPPTSSSSMTGPVTTATSEPSTPVLDYSRSSSKSGSESQGFIGGDDPFFKHKCRLCHKVFGSDSALQIHVRSHTGEKPFLCNICGGRFSTRGNLKVHFQRHKQEFPNVEMNPNPVPEHMDKNPMPMLGSPFPPSALTPFSNPAFMGIQGLMNGFMFPPPHFAPRPPMPGMMHKHQHEERERRASSPSRERRASSPQRDSTSRHSDIKKESSPSQSISEAHRRPSPDTRERSKFSHMITPSSAHMSKSSPVMSMSSIPLVSNYPVMSPLPSHHAYSQHRQAPTSLASSDPYRPTILPSNLLDNDDSLEQFMEISKSETSKLQQLVDNIEHKLTDPNQCVICHRVLSCKSALQMHYRIHTGERPFKCKICGRSFTTKGNLKTHMGVHRAKPPLRMMHQCPVCHKQFTNLLVLQQHIRSHTGMSSLPVMPSLSHLHMYGRQMDDYHLNQHNMKRQFTEDYDKELDLSKKPRLSRDEGRNTGISERLHDDHTTDDHTDEVTDDDDDDIEQNEMDDEANKLAAKDAKKDGLKREDSEGRSTPGDSSDGMETKPEDTEGRPKSRHSDDGLGFRDSIPRSSSPKYLQEDSNTSQDGNYNAYSTSLAALEERVRAIDSTMARNPLSQFHAAPFLLAPNHYSNGERALSPRSESGSDSGEKNPLTPALSVSSNGSIDSNFMIGAMDVRAHLDNKTTTTCNVCYKTFACRSALDIHYRSHTRERPYKCDMCDKSFTTRGNMRQHLLTHKLNDDADGAELENNNNSCTPNQNDNDSDRSNDSSQFDESQQEKMRKDLNESQGSIAKKDASPLEKSTVSLSSSPSLSTVTASRSSSSAYTSPPDNQSPYISKTPTVKHQCLVCQKGFSSASALQIHIRTHTGDKPFKCSVCGKAFTTKGNLKVHMGTHMWNNSPSRRGRRMSIEPPFMLAHKENPYLPHGFPPRPDFYPFQFPPFMNGLPTPPKSLNELSILPGMSGSMGMKPELMSPHIDRSRSKSNSSPVREEKPKFAESGELDLSMKSTGSSGSRSSEKTSPSSVDSNSSSGMVSPPHMSLGWGWKASCHLCSRSFPTPAALEHHVRSMHMMGDSLPKVAAS